jgi:hypothetical protein
MLISNTDMDEKDAAKMDKAMVAYVQMKQEIKNLVCKLIHMYASQKVTAALVQSAVIAVVEATAAVSEVAVVATSTYLATLGSIVSMLKFCMANMILCFKVLIAVIGAVVCAVMVVIVVVAIVKVVQKGAQALFYRICSWW